MLESILRSCLYDVYNQKYERSYTNVLTFMFKVNHQGQVTDSGFSEISDLTNVRINTKIKFLACIQPEIRKVIQLICVTLNSNVNRQSHIIFFNLFDIHDLENVRIDNKINFVL